MFSRYAVYYAPRPGAFADAAATWLGRNCETGLALPQPALDGLTDTLFSLTAKPRKYGFHGTLRAPFRPADGQDGASIAKAVAAMATHLSSARCDGLEIGNPYGFGVAFKPIGDDTEILTLAASVVELTDRLRAPLTLDDIAQRERNENLNPRQREYLHRWGYPMVMEELSFQLTLSNRITPEVRPIMEAAVARHFEGLLPMPFVIEDLCLFGEEAKSGMFRLVHRYRLSG